MSVEIRVEYQGGLRCQAVHGPSGATLTTDAPVDNGGQGASFSPTDLVATALGTCLLTVMGLVAAREGVDLAGLRGRVVKEMHPGAERRIARLTVELALPPGRALTEVQKGKLLAAARACPVHRSLAAAVETPIEIKL